MRAVRDFPTPEKYQEFVKQYFRCIAGVDRSVGDRSRRRSRTRSGADNTVLIYTSDNGFFLGERGLNHKWLMYEESIRVPLIVHDPRVRKAHAARARRNGAEHRHRPDDSGFRGRRDAEGDGRHEPRSRSLGSEKLEWRSHFFYDHHFFVSTNPNNHIPRTEGVRTERWKYITYTDHPEFVELFDLKNDPFEEKNLAGDEKHKEQLAEMKALYEKEVKRLPPAHPGREKK